MGVHTAIPALESKSSPRFNLKMIQDATWGSWHVIETRTTALIWLPLLASNELPDVMGLQMDSAPSCATSLINPARPGARDAVVGHTWDMTDSLAGVMSKIEVGGDEDDLRMVILVDSLSVSGQEGSFRSGPTMSTPVDHGGCLEPSAPQGNVEQRSSSSQNTPGHESRTLKTTCPRNIWAPNSGSLCIAGRSTAFSPHHAHKISCFCRHRLSRLRRDLCRGSTCH